jgi:hypothetical protein
MTNADKLTMLKTILFPEEEVSAEIEAQLQVYLDMASQTILNYKYEYSKDGIPDELPSAFDMVQIMAVQNGFAQAGAEGQVLSIENGIHRHWKYSDMLEYVQNHVTPIAKVQ